MTEVFVRSPWGVQVHECAESQKEINAGRVYPSLVTEIYFDTNEKKPALTNGADTSYVTFCPFCGANLTDNE